MIFPSKPSIDCERYLHTLIKYPCQLNLTWNPMVNRSGVCKHLTPTAHSPHRSMHIFIPVFICRLHMNTPNMGFEINKYNNTLTKQCPAYTVHVKTMIHYMGCINIYNSTSGASRGRPCPPPTKASLQNFINCI